ncbi:MAG TPA: hypothetical protein VGS58_04895 [Candidatus Sulfopaludibacter sp.]|nr:hypothetical protein [Candidatus Sulfopaludibacter sp.]
MRFLKLYAAASTIAFAVVLLTAFQAPGNRFTEIEVERLNLVESSGKLDMVIANSQRMPDPIVSGKTMKRSGASSPGFIFYNGNGDEDGGLVFGSQKTGDQQHAGAALLFDQFNQDQTVGIQYSETNGRRTAGLTVWDRPDRPVAEIAGPVQAMKEGPERTALIRKLREAGDLGATRLFVGKDPDRKAQLMLADTKGRPRLVISVDAAGAPRIAFLDEAGKTTYTLPPSR